MAAIMESALDWAARGFRVFPLAPGEKVPPKGMRFKEEATCDADKIRAWWTFQPAYNVGVATGNGLLVVDVDPGKGGFSSFVAADIPADTLTVRTPSGGMHLYFRGPDVPGSVDRIAEGIDIRSVGGYVVGPGSYFSDRDGRKGYRGGYSVLTEVPLLDAPESLVLAAGSPHEITRKAAISEDQPDDIIYAINYLTHDAAIAIEGCGGNNTTYAVAARVIEMGVSPTRAAEIMLEHWNDRCDPPWSSEELARICEHAGSYAQNTQGSGGVTAQIADFSTAVPLPSETPETPKGKFDAIFAHTYMTPVADIPARRWVAHRILLRQEATILAGPGGTGKSGFCLALAAHGAVGRSFAGFTVPEPFKTIVYNYEDSRAEMEARLYAACATYDLDPREVEKHVLLWPGREQRFRLLDKNHGFAMADIQEVARLARGGAFGAIVLDPLVSLHSEEENDNGAMGDVMDALNGLARLTDAAVLAPHHTPKGVRQAGSSDAVRGASNIVNAVRIAATIYPADDADASLYGFPEGYRARYVRIDDAKQNLAALDTKPLWLEKVGFPLPCGDSSYALKIFNPATSLAGEGKLMAEILSTHMAESATMHMSTWDAAKVLASADTYFRDKLPVTGNMAPLRSLVELRLSQPVTTEAGDVLRVVARTEPGAASARMFVEIA